MSGKEKVNILLVDDQPAKLMSYEVILKDLDENLIKASSGREALEQLLKNEIAVVLVDVCMPELDGFELAAMIREHPRFQKIAMIFISAIQVTDMDTLRGYEMGAVDYVPVPVVPEVLRAKVRVFAELFRKTRQLERLNTELELRVAARTADVEASAAQLRESEHRRSLALAASNMGSWDWDLVKSDWMWDEGQHRIFGVEPGSFVVTPENVRQLLHPEDWESFNAAIERMIKEGGAYETEFRIRRPDGQVRWCAGTAAASMDGNGRAVRVSGVTIDITERKEAEERQSLLAREVDHRAKNALALVQSIVLLTKADSIASYAAAIDGRIKALSRVHTLLSQSRWHSANLAGLVAEELAPYRAGEIGRVSSMGPEILLQPSIAQTLALALHELATNAAKYGALSVPEGHVDVQWNLAGDGLRITWAETGGPETTQPTSTGFGSRIILGSIERQLGGQVTFNWRREGLQCEFFVPRAEHFNLPQAQAALVPSNDPAGPDISFEIHGGRVLVVEDETLVAMVVSDYLAELGYEVIGPHGSPYTALQAIEESAVDAAVLDVNLAGALVYPLAEALNQRKIPFVFVTGYGAESIDPKFSGMPLLHKPIEREAFLRIFPRRATGAAAVPLHADRADTRRAAAG